MKDLVDNTIQFLSAPGEMAELTRRKDWKATQLGPVEEWPQSLRTIIGIILNSKFPMFLWWGPELICLYNDAYRPSLGQKGKHPSILGMKAEDAWPEIWSIIKPLIDQVMNGGEATWSQDQLIPIYRNGIIEDVYWTFSYSPAYDESGKVAGVLVTCAETTAQVLTQKKLEESERRLRAMILQAPASIAVLRGKNHVVEMVNPRSLEIWGRTEQDVLNKPILDAMPELKTQSIKEILDGVYNTGKVFSVSELEVNIIRGGKEETIYVNASWEPIYNSTGEIDGIMAGGVDVTAHVTARKKIKESEEANEKIATHLKLATVSANVGTWSLDIQTQKLEWSALHKKLWGYDEHQEGLVYEDWHKIIVNEDKEKAFRNIEEARINHTVYDVEYRINKADDNEVRWMKSIGKYQYNDNGEAETLTGISYDITERMKFEDSLLESEQKFRLLADSMPQHIWTADTQGNLNYFNKSVFDYSGLSLEKINKDGWLQIVHPDDRERNIKEWIESVATGKDFLLEHRFRRHDGEFRWQLSRAKPQRDENGIIQMWVGTSTDIQEQKTFAEALETEVHDRSKELTQKNIDLEKMNKELQSFAYISSHDLQEPLRKIQTFATRIVEKEKENLSENGKDLFNRMQSSAGRMQALIDDLLAYSRTNTSERVFEKVNLNTVIEKVKQDLKEEILNKNAVIEIKDTCDVNIIPFQFRQLFYNLISNSLKFSNPQKPLHIDINSEHAKGDKFKNESLEGNAEYCHITVADNGIGFEPQYSEKIFELFQHLHGKNEYQGTGIGLAIVKRIVENHNGIIAAKGELGKGATFDIYLPV